MVISHTTCANNHIHNSTRDKEKKFLSPTYETDIIYIFFKKKTEFGYKIKLYVFVVLHGIFLHHTMYIYFFFKKMYSVPQVITL